MKTVKRGFVGLLPLVQDTYHNWEYILPTAIRDEPILSHSVIEVIGLKLGENPTTLRCVPSSGQGT